MWYRITLINRLKTMLRRRGKLMKRFIISVFFLYDPCLKEEYVVYVTGFSLDGIELDCSRKRERIRNVDQRN